MPFNSAFAGKRRALAIVALVLLVLAGAAFWRRGSIDPSYVAVVRRGPLTATLTTSGTLRPIQALTYRSPVAGRELEIADIAPEGTHVNEDDLVVRLDTTDLERDVERAQQDLRQLQLDLQVAEGEWEEADAMVKSVSEGEGALTVEEARSRLQLMDRKAARLRQEYDQLRPLMEKGFITREELAKTGDALEQAEEDLSLARKRTDIVVEMAHPRETKRAALQLAQKSAQLGQARTRLRETETRLSLLRELIERCSLYARRPGLVVYEEYLGAFPRRKIRAGDRVTVSQGIVTIPEVSRMVMEGSVSEAELHRVQPGQPAAVLIEAFPNLRLTGKVSRVGTLATASANRPLEDKRFDLVIELDAADADLRPEMTARADIVVGTRQNVLLLPVTAVFEQQGAFVVSVLERTGTDVRRVDLGESNDEVVEVVTGLRENERVSLVAPVNAAPVAVPKNNPDGLPRP